MAVTVAYATSVLYARLTVPHDNDISDAEFGRLAVNNYIDTLVLEKLRKLRIAPSEPADDAAFLRRAYLDAVGILPTAEVVEEFLADTSADKRRQLVDDLLERPEYADYWAYKWSDLLLVSTNRDHLNRTALWDFYNWIRDSVAQNKPWDQFARDIFAARGSSRENGALNYFVLHKDTIDLAENTTQAFMGQTLTCARCHNHPLEKWTQVQYYRFANLFTRIGIKTGDEPGDSIIFSKDFGDIPAPPHRPSAATNPTRGRGTGSGFPAGPQAAPGGVADKRGQPLFRTKRRQPCLGEFLRAGAGGSSRRPPGHESVFERETLWRACAGLCRQRLRREASDTADHELGDVPAVLDAERIERTRRQVLLEVPGQATAGRGHPRQPVLHHRSRIKV